MLKFRFPRWPAVCLFLTLSSASFLHAADSSDWQRVQALRPGDRIGVIQADQKRWQGALTSVSDSAVTLQQDGREQSVPREQVVRVYRSKGLNRLTRAAIGAGIGIGVGLLVDQTFGRYLRNEGSGEDATAIAIGGGAGIGAALGAATGSGYQTIYRRAAPAPSSPKTP